jgi:hypothetical protein
MLVHAHRVIGYSTKPCQALRLGLGSCLFGAAIPPLHHVKGTAIHIPQALLSQNTEMTYFLLMRLVRFWKVVLAPLLQAIEQCRAPSHDDDRLSTVLTHVSTPFEP